MDRTELGNENTVKTGRIYTCEGFQTKYGAFGYDLCKHGVVVYRPEKHPEVK